MKILNQNIIYLLILSSFLLLPSCSQAGAEQKKESVIDSQALITKAKEITKKFKLTNMGLSCLKFSVLENKIEGKKVIDVREKHNKLCGGDRNTSPRLFSIVINESNGDIWSDAKSLLGQLEKLE